MTKDDMLKELYSIVETISILPPIPYKQFYEDHKNDSERSLAELLKAGRQVLKAKK